MASFFAATEAELLRNGSHRCTVIPDIEEHTQDGEKITGSFSAPGNEHVVEGTLMKGALELAATDMPADTRLTLSGKLQKDGSLAGYLSGPIADAKWTATRAKVAR